MPAMFSTCGTPCMLKMTGNIVAVTGSMYSYAGLGFNLGQTPAGGTTNTPVTPKGNGLTFNFSNTTTGTGLVLRAQLTNGTLTWCTNITTSPAVIPYSSFKVACYDAAPGAAYAKEPITQIRAEPGWWHGAGRDQHYADQRHRKLVARLGFSAARTSPRRAEGERARRGGSTIKPSLNLSHVAS